MARVQLTDGTGDIYSVDEEQAEAAKAKHGLTDATPEQVMAFQQKQAPVGPAALAPPPPPPDAGVPDAGAEQEQLLERAPTPGRVQLIDPRTREIYSVDEAQSEAAQMAKGLVPATTDDVEQFTLQERFGTSLGDKMDAYASTMIGVPAELAEAASKRGMFQPHDPLTGAPIGPAAIDAKTGKLRPGVAQEAEKLVPFVYTASEKAKRAANPNWAAAGAVVPDLATALLIPGGGVAGALVSSVLSGAISEAGASVIDGDEFSVLDMGLAGGTALAMEGVGAIALKAAFGGAGKAKNYIDSALDRAERLGAEDALAEVDPLKQAGKLQRNDEAVFAKVQTEFDQAMEKIDQRLVETPEVMFSPKALKSTVSANLKVQEDAFLDVAVRLENAADLLDTPAVTSARNVLQDSLGKKGHEMYAALHSAKRELEALGSESLVVKDAIEALDGSLRSEHTWGRAAKAYADTADDGASVVGSWNVREISQREALETRLDRARTRATATGDKDLAKHIGKAERALERADKATGARLLSGTTPDDIAKLKKQIEGFEKRGPKLAKELSRSMQKLEKRLGQGSIPRATEDDALDYVAARVHGLGGSRDPIKDVLRQAEKHIEDLKAKGASPLEVGRAQAEVNAVRAAADEVNEIPKAAKRVRDWESHPSRLKQKAADEANSVVEEELEDAMGPVLRAGTAAVGGAVFGVPGYVGGYLLGRAANKKFGQKIAKFIWGKARKNIAAEALKSPGQAVAGAAGAVGGLLLGHGSPAAVATGFYAGRKAGQVAGEAATGLFRRGKAALASKLDDVTRATPSGGGGTPPKPPASPPAPPAKGVTVTAKPFSPASSGDLDVGALNKATRDLKQATTKGDDDAIAAAREAYEDALAKVKPLGEPPKGLKPPPVRPDAPVAPPSKKSVAEMRGEARAQLLKEKGPPPKVEPGDLCEPRSSPVDLRDPAGRAMQASWEKKFVGYQKQVRRLMTPEQFADLQAEHAAILARAWGMPDLIDPVATVRKIVGVEGFKRLTNYGNFGDDFTTKMRSYAMNGALRSGKPLPKKLQAEIGALDVELDKVVAGGGARPGSYFRGLVVTKEQASKLVVGGVHENIGFTSMSPFEELAEQYSYPNAKMKAAGVDQPVRMRIEADGAVPIGIFEALGRRGSKYRIESVGTDPHGVLLVVAREMAAAKPTAAGAVMAALKANPDKALSAVLFAGGSAGALLQDPGQRGETAGAAAASAGLLLLFLPRGMGVRAARSALEATATRAFSRLPEQTGRQIFTAIDAARPNLGEMLRRAARESWEAETLIREQARLVHDVHVARYHGTISAIEGGPEYVRAELWHQNAIKIAEDPELQALHAQATTAAEEATARTGAAPAPRPLSDEALARADLISAMMSPEALRRLAIQAQNALPEAERGELRGLFGEAAPTLQGMARMFIEGRPDPAGRIFRNGAELVSAQRTMLLARANERGLSDAALEAGRLEIVRLNDEVVNHAVDASHAARVATPPPPSPRAQVMDRSAELQPDRLTRLEYDAEQAMTALPQEGRQLLGQIVRDAGDELRELTRRFLVRDNAGSGAAQTAADLIDEQIAVLSRHVETSGIQVPDEVADAAEAAMRAELLRYNAAAALETRRALPAPSSSRLARDEPFSTPSTPPASGGAPVERSYEAFLDTGRQSEAGSVTNRAHQAFDDLGRAPGWSAREINQVYSAFDAADAELREMLQSFVRNEPHISSNGGSRFELRNRNELFHAQRRAVIDHLVGEMGVRADTDFGQPLERALVLELERRNGNLATELHYGGVTAQRTEREAARRAVRQEAEQAGRLKNPDPEIDPPAQIEGLPTDAAVRLDDALQPELERIQELYNERTVGDDTMLRESLGGIEERARAFARDNPGLLSEDDALGYARRRHGELTTEEGIDWLQDGGFARSQLLPPLEDDAIYANLEETVQDLADNGISHRWNNVESSLRDSGLNEREMRRAERVWDARESELDEVWEQRSAPPSSEEPPSSGSYGSNVDTEDIGLPDIQTLNHAGMDHVEVNHQDGIQNVFGRDLTVEEVRGIFSLDHLKKYADDTGHNLDTRLEVNGRSVEFSGKVGADFRIQTTYRQGPDGIEIYYNFLHIPQAMEGTGAAKALIADMVAPLESLGAKKVSLSTAWVGMYAWPKLGARPPRHAELAAFDAFERALRLAVDPAFADQAATTVMGKIDNIRDLADTWLPAHLVKDRMPELRQGWEELMNEYRGAGVKQMSFEEAVMRTSRSGNQQFLAGKYFLLKHPGGWNSDLSFDVAPGTPWYDEFKARVGLSAGVGAIGLGLWELAGAFHGTEAVAHGAGSPRGEADNAEMPPEVEAFMAEQTERDEKVDAVREKLGYVKNQSTTAMQSAVRGLASPMSRERVVPVLAGVTASQGVARFIGSNATLREAYEEKRETLEKMAKDPMALVDELTEGLAELEDTAPELHKSMVAQTYKIVAYLQGKLPSTIGTSLARPRGAPPNDLALRQFALYYSAATEPGTVLADLSNNRARREQVDTLREVWEPAYNQLKTGLVAEMAKGRPTVAQRQRLDLLFDFGDALDTGLSSRLMALAGQMEQAKVAGKDEEGSGGGKSAPGKVPSRRTQPSVAGASASNSLSQGPAGGGFA